MGTVAVTLVFTGVLAVLGVWCVITRCNNGEGLRVAREVDGCLPLLAVACFLAALLAGCWGWMVMLGKLHNQTQLYCCIIFIEAVSRMIAGFFSVLNINKIVILFNSLAVFSKSKSQQRIFMPFEEIRFQTKGGGGPQKNGGGVRRAAIRKY